MTMFEQFKISHRKSTLLINDHPAENFISRSTKIWNSITPKLKLTDFSYKISTIKIKLKNALLKLQNSNSAVTWINDNFNTDKIEGI